MLPGLKRRDFLRASIAGVLAAAVAPRARSLYAEVINVAPETLERVAELFERHPVVDFHTHLGIWQTMGLLDMDPGIGALSGEKLASNIQEYLDAGVNCLYLDTVSDIARTRIGKPGNKDRDFIGDEAWDEYLRQYAMMQQLLEEHPMSVASSAADIEAINLRGELAVILSTEGAHMVERDTGGVIGTFPIRAPFGVSTIDAFTEALKH